MDWNCKNTVYNVLNLYKTKKILFKKIYMI